MRTRNFRLLAAAPCWLPQGQDSQSSRRRLASPGAKAAERYSGKGRSPKPRLKLNQPKLTESSPTTTSPRHEGSTQTLENRPHPYRAAFIEPSAPVPRKTSADQWKSRIQAQKDTIESMRREIASLSASIHFPDKLPSPHLRAAKRTATGEGESGGNHEPPTGRAAPAPRRAAGIRAQRRLWKFGLRPVDRTVRSFSRICGQHHE